MMCCVTSSARKISGVILSSQSTLEVWIIVFEHHCHLWTGVGRTELSIVPIANKAEE